MITPQPIYYPLYKNKEMKANHNMFSYSASGAHAVSNGSKICINSLFLSREDVAPANRSIAPHSLKG